MQIHELTQLKPRQDEAVSDVVRKVSGAVSKAKRAIASPKGGLANLRAAWKQGQVAGQASDLAKRSQAAWNRYVQNWEATMEPDERAKFATRKDDGGLYKRQLTAWVQKNLLSGLPLSSVTNRDQILAIIDDLSEPRQIPPVKEADAMSAGIVIPAGAKTASAPSKAAPTQPTGTPGLTASEEQRLWLRLAQEVGRAQQTAYTGQPEAPSKPTAGQVQTQPPTTTISQPDMSSDVKSMLDQMGQTKNIKAIGDTLQQIAQTAAVTSTGNPAVDGLLRNMGFTVS